MRREASICIGPGALLKSANLEKDLPAQFDVITTFDVVRD